MDAGEPTSPAGRGRLLAFFEVATIGLPFCGYKVLSGLALSGPAGWLLAALGALDLAINGANGIGLLALRRRVVEPCAFALATRPLRGRWGRAERWVDLGNSLDVLLSFTIVAAMIAEGGLGLLSPCGRRVWNVCVILNVLGAGLSRFGESVRALREDERPGGG